MPDIAIANINDVFAHFAHLKYKIEKVIPYTTIAVIHAATGNASSSNSEIITPTNPVTSAKQNADITHNPMCAKSLIFKIQTSQYLPQTKEITLQTDSESYLQSVSFVDELQDYILT